MQPDSVKILRSHSLPLKLKPVHLGQLALLETLKRPAYHYFGGEFITVLEASSGVDLNFLKEYAKKYNTTQIFISAEDYELVHEKLNTQLVQLSRAQSTSDPLKNSMNQAHLLSLQLTNLYANPFDDALLNSQYQNSKNFSNLLFNNKSIHKDLYHKYQKQKHHYIIGQPMLSSILLLSFVQHTKMFTEKEIQTLFLTSYFKDIGMSFIPREKFELAYLSEFDKQLFADHSELSMKILEGRLPFNKTQLNLIANHHFLNYVIQSKIRQKDFLTDEPFISGVESTILSSIDILVAMTNGRPYRDSVSLFKTLEFLKLVIHDDYPQEFKMLVMFMKQFFSK